MDAYQLLINGKFVDGASTMEVINPATEQPVATCPRADKAQLNAAVQAAKDAFSTWKTTNIEVRRAAIMAIAEELLANQEEIARIVVAEQGKPLPVAVEEVMGAALLAQAIGSLSLEDKVASESNGGSFIEQRYPLGVVAVITPWNVPVALLMIKVAPALLAGNTIVAKPAPTTPLSSLRVARIINKHVPPGVFNIITDANDLGAELTAHPDVAKISFTGSSATGKKVLQSASNLLKRVTLELGGNDAAIVLDDVDAKETAKSLFEGAMMNTGQICLAVKRVYAPTSLYDALCDELIELSDKAIVDDGMKQGTQYGPLQNKVQYNKVLEIIADARARGAKVHGGEQPDGPGYFIRPTIVRDIDDDARLVREEQFGPVLPVLRYTDINDAIARANDSEQGLGGTVWAKNIERAKEVAGKMETGMVWINSHMNVNPFVTMGGAKQSGLGSELGQEGLEEFTQRRLVFVPG
jgi:acyl-CoA reductase-like NAD-dependent aldehyde dehydrogenase